MDGSAFRCVGEAIQGAFILLLIALPLAIWKLIDITIWIATHVSVSLHVG